jgi:hypothetical protein
VGSRDPLSLNYGFGLGEGDSSAAATGALTTRTTATGRDAHQSHQENLKRFEGIRQAELPENLQHKKENPRSAVGAVAWVFH